MTILHSCEMINVRWPRPSL